MKNAKLEGMQKGGNMMKKVFGIMMVLVMMASFIAVPASAESNVTLLETWFEDADGVKVYDTSAAKTVNPVFYVNNSGDAAVTDANIILASYDADKRLKSVNYATAPEIPVGESRIEIAETVDTAVGGETYMMIWKDFEPVVEKVAINNVSKNAEILSFSVGDNEGFIANETPNFVYDSNSSTITKSYAREKNIKVYTELAYNNIKPDLTEVVPTITIPEGATISPASGEAQDFSGGKTVDYTVTAADGVTKNVYNVSVQSMWTNYKETVGADYPELRYEDIRVNNTGQQYSVQINSDATFNFGAKPYNTALTANNSNYDSFLIPLRYSTSEIDGGKHVLCEDEVLSTNSYDYSGKAFKYVLYKDIVDANADNPDFDEKTAIVNQTRFYSIAAPGSTEEDPNYALRYLRRYGNGTNSTSLRVIQRGRTQGLDKYKGTIDKMTYSFDFYIPEGVKWGNAVHLGLWHKSKDSASSTYTFPFRVISGKDIVFYGRKSSSLSPEIFRIENGLGKWHTVKFELDLNDLTYRMFYGNELVAAGNYSEAAPQTTFGSSEASLWHISVADSSVVADMYFDNIEIRYNTTAVEY